MKLMRLVLVLAFALGASAVRADVIERTGDIGDPFTRHRAPVLLAIEPSRAAILVTIAW